MINWADSTTYQWIVQRGIAPEHVLAFSQGYVTGIPQGAVRQAQRMVLRLGAKRFGPAPAAAEAAVRGLTDRDRLERMAERTLDATGWDELLATA